MEKVRKNKRNKLQKPKGITLVALVITIIILLILAGISISTLGGENGLITKVNQAKKMQIKSDMKEVLSLAILELQTEKNGKATIDDITQEWIDKTITEYQCKIIDDVSIEGKIVTMKKDDIIGKFKIDLNLNILNVEYENTVEFYYDVEETNGNKIKILIHVKDEINGLSRIEFPDRDVIVINNITMEERAIDYEIEYEKEYIIKITSGNGKEVEMRIKHKDSIAPSANIVLSATKVEKGNPITATVTHNDNETGIDIGKCKWVYNKIQTEIGTKSEDYTGGTFTNNTEKIELNEEDVGIYYLHVLTVDKSGNAKETISDAVTVGYKWNKYSIEKVEAGYTYNIIDNGLFAVDSSSSRVGVTSLDSFDETTGTWKIQKTVSAGSLTDGMLISPTTSGKVSEIYVFEEGFNNASGRYSLGAHNTYRSEKKYINQKGSSSYGSVISENISEYPENGEQGNYWYERIN